MNDFARKVAFFIVCWALCCPSICCMNECKSETGYYLGRCNEEIRSFFLLFKDLPPDIKRYITSLLLETCLNCNFELLKQFKAHAYAVCFVLLASDGKTAITNSLDGTCRLWELPLAKEVCVFFNCTNWVSSVVSSPKREQIIIYPDSGALFLWNIFPDGLSKPLLDHHHKAHCAAFSPDGEMIVAGLQDGTVYLFDAKCGDKLRVLRGHIGGVCSVTFSSDGRTIITGSSDGTARLWDAFSGKEFRRLEGHAGRVCSVAFSSDGTMIITGSSDGTVYLWSLKPCGVSDYIVQNLGPLGAWFIVWAFEAQRVKGSFAIDKKSLEHAIFMVLPDKVKEYIKKWYSVEII